MTKADVKPNFANLEPIINILHILSSLCPRLRSGWAGTLRNPLWHAPSLLPIGAEPFRCGLIGYHLKLDFFLS
jgi:hypothetical protein